jgi:hypothetical protein
MVEGDLPDSRGGWSVGVGGVTGDLGIVSVVVLDDSGAEKDWGLDRFHLFGRLHLLGNGLQGEQGACCVWVAVIVLWRAGEGGVSEYHLVVGLLVIGLVIL